METKVLELLNKTLPSKSNIIVKKYKGFYNVQYLKIMFSVSNIEINRVSEQYPQVVSLCLNLDTMELEPQGYSGVGGQTIYRDPDKNDPKERFLCMKGIKIPFRKPKTEEKFVLSAIERFGQNWVEEIRKNKEVLRYRDIVNYDEFLVS